jgi:hypothetical protein
MLLTYEARGEKRGEEGRRGEKRRERRGEVNRFS